MAATKHAQHLKNDSREYLTTALLQLLDTRDLADITVTQVVKRAGVSRMAFYRNFDTLDDLLTAYFTPAIASQFSTVLTHQYLAAKERAMGEFFIAFAPTLELAVRRGFEHIIRTIFNREMVAFYQTTMADSGLTTTQLTYWTGFMSAGVYQIWRDWLLNGQREPLNEIHDLIRTLQTSTMRGLLDS